jgi:hypothetical protein
MVVTVTATTTSGKELPDDALEKVCVSRSVLLLHSSLLLLNWSLLLLNRSLLTRVYAQVTKAAEQVLELDATRLKLLEYIESRMNILAPNLTVIVGSKVATH